MTDSIKEHVRALSHLSKLSPETAEKLFLRPVRIELGERVQSNPTYRLTYFYALNLISRMFPFTQFEPIADEPLVVLP